MSYDPKLWDLERRVVKLETDVSSFGCTYFLALLALVLVLFIPGLREYVRVVAKKAITEIIR